MKKMILLCCFFIINFLSYSQELEGAKDPELFPKRMPNYLLTEQSKNYDALDFNLAEGGSKVVNKEGNKVTTRYDFNGESGQQKPSALQILRNYENAIKSIGGTSLYLNAGEGLATFKITKGGKETWIKMESGGSDNSDFYVVTVLDLEAMHQEITASEMLTALSTSGHIALYINFETGKAEIKPESQPIIDQIVDLMKQNPSLKISLEGHTDNTGNAAANKTLSENRSKAVVNAISMKGIDKTRLSSKGWGQEKPVSDNATEDGKAKNRRVEVVKM